MSRQYANVLIEQSRNVLLTWLTLGGGTRRTTTDELDRSRQVSGVEEGEGQKDRAAAGDRLRLRNFFPANIVFVAGGHSHFRRSFGIGALMALTKSKKHFI